MASFATLDVEPGQRLSVFGKTGSGKTVFSWALLRNEPRLVVLDPKGTLGEYDADGNRNGLDWALEPWTRQTEKRLLAGQAVRIRIPPPEPGSGVNPLAYWEQAYALCYRARKLWVYTDEVYGVVPPGRQPGEWLTACYTRGRELGIGMWAASQRPAWVPLFIRSEVEWLVAFQLLLWQDKQRLAEVMGPAVLDDPTDPFGFYLYHTSGWPSPVYSPGLEVTGLQGSGKGKGR